MLGWCPKCDTLREITRTDIPVGHTGTAKRWRVVMHPSPVEIGTEPTICVGSGALI